MTASIRELNSLACASLRIRPVVDAAIILVVSLCVVILRIIAPTV